MVLTTRTQLSQCGLCSKELLKKKEVGKETALSKLRYTFTCKQIPELENENMVEPLNWLRVS
jgi:hypothetical protein